MGDKTKKQEIAVPQGSSPADMIRLAVSGGADLDKLEKLLTLQERYESNEARKIFASSFANAQAKIGAVVKTKLNPQTHSKYADLGDVIKSAQPIYTKEGFSVIFYEGETATPESVRICADVLHMSGHKETYHYDVPMDGMGLKGNANMTKIHGKASSTAYARRYLMCMIWNIPTQDDDAKSTVAPVELIGDGEMHKIRDILIAKDIKEAQFLAYMKLEKLEDMPKAKFQQAVTTLTNAKKKASAK